MRRVRVDEARRLLEETDLPIKDISARTGLGDVSTMWRLFVQHLGVTPTEYRGRFALAETRSLFVLLGAAGAVDETAPPCVLGALA